MNFEQKRISHAIIFSILILLSIGNLIHAQTSHYSYISTLGGMIYKVDLSNCTSDSIANINPNNNLDLTIDDIALSPSGKLYIVTFDTTTPSTYILSLDLTTHIVTQLGSLPLIGSGADALVCDSVGNLLTITGDAIHSGVSLFYIDTLNASLSYIQTILENPAGDLTYYQGNIYYNDQDDVLHLVTLNPSNDTIIGPTNCTEHGANYGLSTNLVDTNQCEPYMFLYSKTDICRVYPQTGATTPWCTDVIPDNGTIFISGAASLYYNPTCQATKPNSIIPIESAQKFAMPDAFTPNGDGKNDSFYPLVNNGATVLDFKIYNRWGQLIHDSPQPWDGNYNSTPQPEGMYMYHLTISTTDTDNNPVILSKEGGLTLMR